jgi:hypothetical protein
MTPSLLGAAELSSPEHVEYATRFSTKSTGAEAITARVNVVVKPLPPIPRIILSIYHII